jgi:hypothetical protein
MRKKGESNGNSTRNNLVRARRNDDSTVPVESQSAGGDISSQSRAWGKKMIPLIRASRATSRRRGRCRVEPEPTPAVAEQFAE